MNITTEAYTGLCGRIQRDSEEVHVGSQANHESIALSDSSVSDVTDYNNRCRSFVTVCCDNYRATNTINNSLLSALLHNGEYYSAASTSCTGTAIKLLFAIN